MTQTRERLDQIGTPGWKRVSTQELRALGTAG